MGIVAAFDKMLFSNPASKYCVMRVKTANMMIPQEARDTYRFRDNLTRFVAVGYDLPQTDSIQVDLEGKWVNSKHGVQFQVEHWREVIPPTLDGIRSYLSSGLLKGIGPKTAAVIVDKFGIASLDVIENHPERLLEVRGITEEKLEEIKNGYAESKAMRDLMILLSPFKVTPSTAMKIYQHFGPGGVALLQQSPFRLCQIPGFGFRRVDDIVQKSGGDLQDPLRVQGAVFYALEKSRSEGGHLFVEAGDLIKTSLLLLNEKTADPAKRVAAADVQQELTNMILADIVVANSGNIYLPHVYTQEIETARRAVQMALEPTMPVNIASVMERVRAKIGMNLSRRQAEAVEMVIRHNLSIITGGPGTGKSTVLKAVVEAYRFLHPGKHIVLGAPTGKASRRMAETTGVNDASTLHSILKLHGEDDGWQAQSELDADFVIVDETSMVDMWLAHQLFSRLKRGAKLLLVGDADQLESVGAGMVFQSLIESGVIPVTVLDEIFRQAKDSLIAYNAKRVKEQNANLYYGRDFAFIKADDQQQTAELIRGIYRQEIAATGMEQVQILTPFRSTGDASADNLNEAIRAEVNPPGADVPEVSFGGKLFRLNDRVMQTKNDYDVQLRDAKGDVATVGVFNGDVGRVSGIGSGMITVEFDGRFADYPFENLNELDLCYATTIHKSQGSEYDTVIIPMLAAHKILLSINLFYTAITRAKRRVILVGQKKALHMALAKSGRAKRNTLLAERMRQFYRVSQKRKAS
jgi:exodeoxyribonuclease V alpha subunit